MMKPADALRVEITPCPVGNPTFFRVTVRWEDAFDHISSYSTLDEAVTGVANVVAAMRIRIKLLRDEHKAATAGA